MLLFTIRIRPQFSPAPRAGSWKAAVSSFIVLAVLAISATAASAAQPPVGLGTADSFAILASSAVTNTGPSTINGNLGVSPGTAVSGFPPGTVNGTVHSADAVAGQAQFDLTTGYNDAAGRTPPLSVPADLGGLTLTAGVYKSGAALGLTGALTLDAQGNPNAVFIFQASSTLITASGSDVKLINGAQPCNVYWQIGSSATLGSSSVFVGNILAYTSISMNNAVTVHGRALARNGAVTLINDTITAGHCATGGGSGTATGSSGGSGSSGGNGNGTASGAAGPGPGAGGSGAGPGAGAVGTRTGSNGTSFLTTTPRGVANTVGQFGTTRCVRPTFRVRVTGLYIRRVVFSLRNHILATRTVSPFAIVVAPRGGIRTVTARVTFTDSTRAVTLRMRFRACSSAERTVSPPSRLPQRPPGFTG